MPRIFLSRGLAILLIGLAAATPVRAGEQADLLQLRNTVLNLVDALVKQGVLTKAQADALVKKAEQDAAKQTEAQVAQKPASAPPENAATVEGEKALAEKSSGKVVRVPYVPEFVKDQIREQVRNELRQDVVADVMQRAKKEKWGLPEALPEWVSNIKLYGDVRLRDEYSAFGSDNPKVTDVNNPYYSILTVNSKGVLASSCTTVSSDPRSCFHNTSANQNQGRVRVRLGMEAKIADSLKFDARLTTGSQANPVSTNQSLGNTGQRYEVQLDRAYLQYDGQNSEGFNWLTASGGRIPNPFLSTELVYDEDLNFEGAALTYRHHIGGETDSPLIKGNARQVFATVGAFPLQNVQFSARDKWLFGAQLGANWEFDNQSTFKIGAAYYDYSHITGKRNGVDSHFNDYSAPQYLQKGNLLFNIANSSIPNSTAGLYALAAKYELIDVTASIDFAQLDPYHVTLTGDIVKNIGYDQQDVLDRTLGGQLAFRTGGAAAASFFKARTLGYQVNLTVGWPKLSKLGDWQVFGLYKYLQRDAVLDAFTDSDFHLGGTDAQGYIVGGKLGLTRNTWFQGRLISTTEIDGAPLSIDTLQFDLNAKF